MKLGLTISFVCVLMLGCQSVSFLESDEASTNSAQNLDASLYERLGGEYGINKIVDNFISEIGRDKAILPYFAKSNVTRFRNQFIDHVCALSGGPCTYEGDAMTVVHDGMNISESDFNRVVVLLQNAMEAANTPVGAQNELIAILAPMRGDIIYRD